MTFKYERIDKDKAVLLIVDHQEGLYQLVRDSSPTDVKNNILAHAALGKIFNLPTIMTTSAETGANGPLPKEVLEMHPNAPLVKRHGEVNAWDNPDFRAAVEATGRTQVIMAGITTDVRPPPPTLYRTTRNRTDAPRACSTAVHAQVCTTFLALSLVEAGYAVFANSDGSGTFDAKTAQDANARMRAAGVHVLSMFAVACELMRDWRGTPGTPQMMPFFDTYLPEYGFLARAHDAAMSGGTPSGL
ncbi:Isochorismatase hydrolase [Trametes gibbosa]|nr:Isochorismatase hydrolase [Trametes gibbosa]